jgi:Predicted O-linked N-acetylglucosamine transferase, SPINDLY family
LKTKDSLKYFDEVKKDFGDNLQLLKAISRVYQFNVRAKDRNKILKDIVRLSPSSINDWCSYIYINNFFRDWDQKQYYSYSKELSNNIKNFNLEKISLDQSIKNRKIKIAFLSSDIYRGHSVTYFILGLLKNINRNKFKMFAISNSKICDEENNELKGQFDDWYNIKQLNDIDAIKFVREKNFDIVFDIMGFTSENRITLFKNRIAPIQISWLGYCNTTGLEEMDYILSDKNLIFQDEEDFYSEKVKNFNEIWNVHCGLK